MLLIPLNGTQAVTLGPFLAANGSIVANANIGATELYVNGAARSPAGGVLSLTTDANGCWSYSFHGTDTAAVGHLRLLANASGALPQTFDAQVVAVMPTSPVNIETETIIDRDDDNGHHHHHD